MKKIDAHLYIDEDALWLKTSEGFSKLEPIIIKSDKYLVTDTAIYSREGYPVARYSFFPDMYIEFDDGLAVPAERLTFYRDYIKDHNIIKSILGMPVITKRLPIQIDVDYIRRAVEYENKTYTVLLDGFVYLLDKDTPEYLIMRGAFKAVNNPKIQDSQILFDGMSIYEVKSEEGFWIELNWIELNLPFSFLKRVPHWKRI